MVAVVVGTSNWEGQRPGGVGSRGNRFHFCIRTLRLIWSVQIPLASTCFSSIDCAFKKLRNSVLHSEHSVFPISLQMTERYEREWGARAWPKSPGSAGLRAAPAGRSGRPPPPGPPRGR